MNLEREKEKGVLEKYFSKSIIENAEEQANLQYGEDAVAEEIM